MALLTEVVLLGSLICLSFGTTVNSDNGATLLEIKKSFKDVNNVLYDWTASPSSDYCVWRGVTCDNVTFNVVALNLSDLNLDGEISPAIGDLKSLLSIDLRGNRLSGQIPDEIGDCSSLQNLDLSFNELSGDIPFSISKLKQLEQLGLRGNNLVGNLSPDLCQLTGLWYFDVRNNSLTGSIPETIGNCTAFQVLDLSYNQLTGEIPFDIGFLQVATLLDSSSFFSVPYLANPFFCFAYKKFWFISSFRSLQGNQLSGKIPSVIGLMQALAVLDLSGNMLNGPIPPILGNLTFTEKLYLHSNKLTGSIPPELGNMSKLHYLELNDNRLTGHIPPELGKLTDLFDLNVANNNLEGLIPDHLSSCTNLNSLNVHGNKFSGNIPRAFQKLESMTYLNLSNNNIRGPIPVELSRIGNLDTLDLSNNKINGNIPSSLGDLEHLLKIDLSNNDISGPIPEELNQLQNMYMLRLENNNLTGNVGSLVNCLSLTVLNVSYNNLVGDIPKSNNFSRFSPDSFIGNPGLCGSWVNSPCHVSRPTVRVSISRAAILGIAIGGFLILVMVLIAACRPHNPPPFLDGSLDKPVTYSHPKLVILHMNMALHVYEDIMRMTENLSEKYIIGHGASSTVYKCVLKNCKPVAIKRLYSHSNPQSVKQFETELELLSSIKHRNLVSLQAYSLSPLGSLLFYDYMDNGSLWDLLHGPAKKKKNTLLDWDTRLKIAYGAAQGLAYLHHDCSPRIIHRDVKSSNILLDKDLEARLTDFGIAKSLCVSKSHTSTYVMGTIGYIDPEYARTSRLTEKSDVYSYGIVLLELLTGRKAVDDEFNLHHLIMSKTVSNAVMEMVDNDITSTCKDLAVVKKVFQLALLCTKRQPNDRPTMHQVVRVLGSFMFSEQPPAANAVAAAAAATSATLNSSCYVDEYANLKAPHNVNCSSMNASDAELFLRFGQVISQNSV
ncbi:hypothetical protein IGI04_038109 [Brassica rapa subsp. trilocularis]|uniref:Protein kinase domain-containing protein n=1 Tax=Brassica rapa subsp. trilocularis TaxID=1813537 RepID=A0ABQ7LMC2_BRACM|nr:hypothetical protein IGI04_038109 [Brassica rapa subsp. trilocularis]